MWLKIEPRVKPLIDSWFLPRLYRFLTKVHLGTIAYAPDTKTSGRARVFWEACEKRAIKIWEFQALGRGRELFVASWNEKELAFDNLPRPGGRKSESSYWMDDKSKMRTIFKKAGIPVATGGTYFWWWALARDFKKLSKPVIIKPHAGSRSRHTTTHIEDLEGLRIAFKKAKRLSPLVIMEEEHRGFVYRGTLIGGRVAGVLCREPACVVGDGVSTIFELVRDENKNPLRDENIFHKIVLGREAAEELSRQKLTLENIPAKNQIVTFSQKASRGIGGGITDVTDIVHTDNLEILYTIANVLDDPLVGVDFMIEDITRSWKEQKRSGVIECNSTPFIDLHHFPLRGKARDVAGMLADLVFPESRKPHQT